ncbi:C-methyltransferase [Paraglaciecola sp. T6c]|uniref:class I SAM-dependent methyltransferase n=1 Tax=Pseudoalteromonas atlantica (strain T6c / ATCC BAA-1087) TaxID=3042615 RepID=UPI00005C60C0|nr:class I SAM-dependent methyltransferase [Paraglaciecola sp. T6c]ABG41566.1 C-methyltransferase [Paraglaciecola sp. T6c]
MKCRHCQTALENTFIDLGFAPPSNAYLTAEQLKQPEVYYPLKVKVCEQCWLVQTEDYAQANDLFNADYAYFSSTSSGWTTHAQRYSEAIIQRLNLDKHSHVIEIASNDGYLLKNFVAADIPCLGIEPTASTAAAAEKLGIPVLREFFGEALAAQLAKAQQQADLIIGNNVYAHVPDINDFTCGLKALLKPEGTITLEFPHLMQLIQQVQFDTIYHEHFSYLSLFTVTQIFAAAGLRIWDVETLPTHGGSLRIYACHAQDKRTNSVAVKQMLDLEKQNGLQTLSPYQEFQQGANKVKNDLLAFLVEQKRLGKKVVAYGAAAKGNTLLNYAGVKPDLLPFVCDAALSKQGKFMPGSHIPILSPTILEEASVDYVLILPWNIKTEVKSQLAWLTHTTFVTAIPNLDLLK